MSAEELGELSKVVPLVPVGVAALLVTAADARLVVLGDNGRGGGLGTEVGDMCLTEGMYVLGQDKTTGLRQTAGREIHL